MCHKMQKKKRSFQVETFWLCFELNNMVLVVLVVWSSGIISAYHRGDWSYGS
jgi:hypothetical protein